MKIEKNLTLNISEFEYGGEIVLEIAPLITANERDVYLQLTINGNDLTTNKGELSSSSILLSYMETGQLVYELNEMLKELNPKVRGEIK